MSISERLKSVIDAKFSTLKVHQSLLGFHIVHCKAMCQVNNLLEVKRWLRFIRH